MLKVCLTHDIDRVHKSYQYATHFAKGNWRSINSLFSNNNPYWMFDEMIDLETKYGAKSTIFFLHETIPFNPISLSNWKLSLGRYSLKDKAVSSIIRELHEYGWEIGLHGSYNSYKNYELLKFEKNLLENVLGSEVKGIRQHYLNLIEPDTWELQKKAGFVYDASLGRTDGIGFKDHRRLPFKEDTSGMFVIPLTFMECYLFDEANNKIETAIKLAIDLMNKAEKEGIVYTILWHQRMFNKTEFPGYYDVYEEILREAKNRNAEFVKCKDIIKILSLHS